MFNARTLFFAAAIGAMSCGAGAQVVITQPNLSFDGARDMALTTMDACRKQGFRVTVTVLDRTGRTRVMLHDDNANPHTIENSLRKAHTALTFRMPSVEMQKRAASNPSVLHLANVVTGEGGLPVVINKQLVGSIGVSGAPGGDKDAACAQAGIERISKGPAQ